MSEKIDGKTASEWLSIGNDHAESGNFKKAKSWIVTTDLQGQYKGIEWAGAKKRSSCLLVFKKFSDKPSCDQAKGKSIL